MKTTEKPLDVVFVLDCTESMTPWIVAARNQIQNTMEHIRDKYSVPIQIALVAYRDFGDEVERSIVDFTDNFDRIRGKLNTLRAEGGFDQAEDLAGALYDTNHYIHWSSNSKKLCFVLTDAPTHGSIYHHAGISDRWADETEIPSRISFTDQIDTLAENDVHMTFVRITPDTDKMVTIMGSIYDEHGTPFNVFNLPRSDQETLDAGFSGLLLKQVTFLLANDRD